MREAGRVGDDSVGDKRYATDSVGHDTRLPTTIEHCINHLALPPNIAGYQGVESRYNGGILDHILWNGKR